MDLDIDIDTDTTTQEIILAASNHDTTKLRELFRSASANVQDPETGITPLHAAIAACAPDVPADQTNTRADGVNVNGSASPGRSSDEEAAAVETVKLLFENGAVWNDLDHENETPGCLALRLKLKNVYDVIVEAGIRAELLLNRLDEFEMLADADDEEYDEPGEAVEGFEVVNAMEEGSANLQSSAVEIEHSIPELIQVDAEGTETEIDVNSADYLASDLIFHGDRLLDADNNGVMMAWETDIMKRTAKLLVPKQGLRILNVGHGMGIIDALFQGETPSAHHIIEAHPDVLARMRRDGWYEKPGVTVHEGRWQDLVPKLVEDNVTFDAIYFDTFAEDYKALKEFFSECVIGLLDLCGKFGFFSGLGADRQICYDVYTKIVEMELFEAGLDTTWEDVHIPDLEGSGEWQGVRRRYWALENYRLPICEFVG
ncbi:Arginine N-methyltransferase 2 [Elasticomyces elasticus]|nr:Arginine N-methyltransferase 2 [Elasticomyces elasticus]